jgi:6-phosphofructokinase 1
MPDLIKGAAVIGQSGGPTAVINQSLVGVVQGLQGIDAIDGVFGMRHGVRGLISGELIDLEGRDMQTLDRIAQTPSAALGSTRDKPDAEYCQKIFATCRERNIRYFFYIGGNDSSDTCRIVNELANEGGYELRCFHVPKTIDNDLVLSDHTPGYPSAARYVALAFAGDNLDNRALPGVKINVIMGRHAGFLTGAAALLKRDDADGPHLVYVPERTFDIDGFVADVDRCLSSYGRCQIAVSEGIQDESGQAIGAKLIEGGEADAHGNVQLSGSGALGDQLAALLKSKLKPVGGKPPRVRADTLGYPQRSFPEQSPVDAREAREAGAFAASMAKSGDLDGSIAIVRTGDDPYGSQLKRIELTDVAAKTRHMPDEFINDAGNGVTDAFTRWLTPLVGPMPELGYLD